MENKHDTEFVHGFMKHPTALVQVCRASLGFFGCLAGLAAFFLFAHPFGAVFAVPMILGGLPCFVAAVYALLITRYTEPFGTSAYDRAILSELKNVLAAGLVVFILFLCLGCLAFL